MGYKERLEGAYTQYYSQIFQKPEEAAQDPVVGRLLNLKKILSGEMRSKQNGGYWSWESRLEGAKKVLGELQGISGNITKEEAYLIKQIRDITFDDNKYLKTKARNADMRSAFQASYQSVESNLDGLYLQGRNREFTEQGLGESAEEVHAAGRGLEAAVETMPKTRNRIKGFLGNNFGKLPHYILKGLVGVAALAIVYSAGVKNTEMKYASQSKQNTQIEQTITYQNKTHKENTLTPSLKEGFKEIEEKKYAPQNPLKTPSAFAAETSLEEKVQNHNEKMGNKANLYHNDIPEFSPEEEQARGRVKSRYANIHSKVKRDGDKIVNGVKNVVVSPFKFVYNTLTFKPKAAAKNVLDTAVGAFDAQAGVLGIANATGETIVRVPTAYAAGKAEAKGKTKGTAIYLDNRVHDFFDASIGGDFDNEINSDLLRVHRWGKQDGLFYTVKDHPIKTTINVAEKTLLILWLSGAFDGDEGGSVSSGGSSGGSTGGDVLVPGAMGRRGGAGVATRGGGAAVAH